MNILNIIVHSSDEMVYRVIASISKVNTVKFRNNVYHKCQYLGSNGLIRVEANNVYIKNETFHRSSYYLDLELLELFDHHIQE